MAQKTSFGNISPETAALFVCDMQERFKPAIKYFDDIAVVAKRLVSMTVNIYSLWFHT